MAQMSPAVRTPGLFGVRRRALIGVLVIAVGLGAFGCDSGSKKGEAKSEFAAYCDATFELESYFAQDPDVDFSTASPDQIAAAVKVYLQGAKPFVDRTVPLVPAEIKGPIDVQVAAFNQALAGGNPEEIFETPAVQAAEKQSHAFDLKNCGWNKVEVSAVEYRFEGLPTELEAGRTSIDLTNKGSELHEIVVLSKNPGVTQSFDEILALPEREGQTKVTDVTGTFAPQGDTDYAVSDIPKGEYIAVCFIPQGATSEESEPSPDAKPHFQLGMKQEITVT